MVGADIGSAVVSKLSLQTLHDNVILFVVVRLDRSSKATGLLCFSQINGNISCALATLHPVLLLLYAHIAMPVNQTGVHLETCQDGRHGSFCWSVQHDDLYKQLKLQHYQLLQRVPSV